MAEQDTFGSLLAGLRRAPGVVPKLRILGSGARSLRHLSPRERGVLLKMAGLGGAEALVERLATGDQETDRAFRRLVAAIEKRPDEFGESVRGLLDPARRAEAAGALIHSLDAALNPEEEQEEPDEPDGPDGGEPAAAEPGDDGRIEVAETAEAPEATERPEPTPSETSTGPQEALASPPPPPRPAAPPEPPAGPETSPATVAEPLPSSEPPPPPAARPEPEPEAVVQEEPEPAARDEPGDQPRAEPGVEPRPDPWAEESPGADRTPGDEPHPLGAGPSRTPLGTTSLAAGAVGAAGLATAGAAGDGPGADDLWTFRRRLAEGAEATLAELHDRLTDEAPTWSRRRTVQAWIDSAEPETLASNLDRLLDLVAGLPGPADRLWCLTSLARVRAWSDGEWTRIAELAGSPAHLRRLRKLRLSPE